MVGDYQFTCPVLEFAQQLAESPDYNKKYAGPRKLISGASQNFANFSCKHQHCNSCTLFASLQGR